MQFLNRSDGFVYGDAAAFVTHDGGDHWAGAGIAFGIVLSMTGRGNSAWALTLACDPSPNVPCNPGPYLVQQSADGGRHWTSPRPLAHLAGNPKSLAFSDGGLLIWGRSQIVITTDGGVTWRLIASACTNASADLEVATSDGHEIWSVCTDLVYSHGPNVSPDIVIKGPYVSEDGGTSWSETSRPATVLGEGAGMSLISPAKGIAFITSLGTPTIYVTRDAGQTWGPVTAMGALPANGFFSLRLGGPTDFWAIGFAYTDWIWASHDGGATWSMLPDPRVWAA